MDGEFAPTSEVPLHTGIYAATNALAITHAHAMASTALSCCYDELPALHYSCLSLGGSPRTAAYATFGSQKLAENVIEALQGPQRGHDAEPRFGGLRLDHGSRPSNDSSFSSGWPSCTGGRRPWGHPVF